MEVSALSLAQALRLGRASRVALVGAGGKTSALFQLGRTLPPPVYLTTTTHLGLSQTAQADRHFVIENSLDLDALENLAAQGPVLLTGPESAPGKVGGLGDQALERLLALADAQGASLVVEADGARQYPLKAPADHEPVIPDFVKLVVVTAGLAGLGQPLAEPWVHRPERFAALSGLVPGQPVSVEAVAKVLRHPEGGLKNIPPGARRVVLLNQASTPEREVLARQLAERLLPPYETVIISDLRSEAGQARIVAAREPVAGIVLAAGESRRLGRPKQLLDWQGEPFVRRVAQTALEAGLSPVVVVTGASGAEVTQAVAGLPVQAVENAAWAEGQSTSIKAGLAAVPAAGAVVFLLADQPHIPVALVRAIVETHAMTLAPLVAPRIEGRRSNPVLFDRQTFPRLFQLQGDRGGRDLFDPNSGYNAAWVDWPDPTVLLDVDTQEDYQRLIELGRGEA